VKFSSGSSRDNCCFFLAQRSSLEGYFGGGFPFLLINGISFTKRSHREQYEKKLS